MIESARLLEIIDAAGLTARSYGGRGMGGRQCVSVTIPVAREGLGLLIRECADVEEAALLVETEQRDAMGRGIVIYWPRSPWPSDRDDDE